MRVKGKEIYLIFKPSYKSWVSRILKKKFGHVMILVSDEQFHYLINPGFDGFDIQITPFKPEDPASLFFSRVEGLTVVKFKTNKEYRFSVVLTFLSCVEIAKYILGIKSFWIRTPYQLYKYTIRHGGRVIQ